MTTLSQVYDAVVDAQHGWQAIAAAIEQALQDRDASLDVRDAVDAQGIIDALFDAVACGNGAINQVCLLLRVSHEDFIRELWERTARKGGVPIAALKDEMLTILVDEETKH